MEIFSGIGPEYLGMSGGVLALLLLVVAVAFFAILIPYLQRKYRKEAEGGILCTFHHPDKKRENIICKLTPDRRFVEYNRKKGRFGQDAREKVHYVVSWKEVTYDKHPYGRPRFLQVDVPALSFTLNNPKPHNFYGEEPLDPVGVVQGAVDDNTMGQLYRQVREADRNALGTASKWPVLAWVLLGAIVLLNVATILIVRGG